MQMPKQIFYKTTFLFRCLVDNVSLDVADIRNDIRILRIKFCRFFKVITGQADLILTKTGISKIIKTALLDVPDSTIFS